MRRSIEAAMFGFVAIVMLGCGGKQSVASKSADAYRDAVARGQEVAGGGHGGHHVERSDTAPGVATGAGHDMTAMQHETGTAMAGMDHAHMEHGNAGAMNHGASDHAEMTGMTQMNHANMQHGASSSTHNMAGMKQGSMEGMDHSAMQHDSAAASHDMAGMQHGSTGSATPNMNMDHSQMQNMPGMSHGSMTGMQHGGAIPAGGLWGPQSGLLQQTDAVDTPAPSSVREAQKSASDDMSGMNHGASATSDHSGHASSSGTDEKQEVTYTCPMHPEVISSQPGTCPKCGMLLVRRGSK